MIESVNKKSIKSPPDFKLLISRIENEIILGRNQDAYRSTLARESIWKNLETEKQLKWARLAQMAGEIEVSLNILAHINRTHPKMSEAWIERIELLFTLDRRKEMAQVLATAKTYADREKYLEWVRAYKETMLPKMDKDVSEATKPFEKLRERQTYMSHYLELFSGREDYFARQWVNKEEAKQGYVPVRHPLGFEEVDEHLKGRKTYGMYLIHSDGTVKVAVIDADIVSRYRNTKLKLDEKRLVKREYHYLVSRIKELSGKIGLSPLVEFSGGKGWHFWFFFESPVKAGEAKRCLEGIKNVIKKDLSAFSLEVFPKQDKLSGKGFGNLVKLPLGVHRLNGKRSYFVDCDDRSPEGQLKFLSSIKPCKIQGIKESIGELYKDKVLVHPRWKKWADDYPELFKLEDMCPPLGQIIATCRNGQDISLREEKVLFQTIGFLPRAKTLIHYLMSFLSDYNTHMVDYKLSRLRGTPLGCKRIHSLLDFTGDMCPFGVDAEYAHPLLHLEEWKQENSVKSEKIMSLSSALEGLKDAMSQVERFLR
jgi:hypothetical protein